jgi:threonyl-tRNA synthetase
MSNNTLTLNREDYLYKLRHSTTHVMAQAVQDLFPGTKLTIGPPVEDGFYYDFESDHRFVPEDLEKIESRMRQIVEGNHAFVMSTHSSEDARKFWGARGEKYKVEMINDLNEPTVTYCSHDQFVDLCRGHHLDTTADIRHFKLLKIAGAYWRGDEKRERLQRIYGTAWPSAKELADYLARLEEAKKRDHRELGPRLGLFTIQHESGGSGFIYWLPKGALVRRLMEDTLKDYLGARGYDFVYTPHVARSDLWKTSGHLDYYRENMYPAMELENQEFLLKPMNCPGHILIYKSTLHSYRELPLRYAEFGTVYRFERSGVLHGLMRVRGFDFKGTYVWTKMRRDMKQPAIGMGHLFRQSHELAIVGVIGKPLRTIQNRGQRSACLAINKGHSIKPEALQDSLDLMWPSAAKLEMFARRQRPGWTCLGDELDGLDIRQTLPALTKAPQLCQPSQDALGLVCEVIQ